jgi:RimJ/RimL family protein N-acetyltransferase
MNKVNEKFSVIQLTPSDWKDYKSIRLEALAAHPNFFCPSRDETKFTEEDWKQRLSNLNAGTFGLYFNGKLIGLTGIVRDHVEIQKAHLVSSYIRPEYRRIGLSKLLYQARIAWAQKHETIKYLVVDHNQENEPSYKAHQKFGFKYSRSYVEASSTGDNKTIVSYRLDI